MCVYGSMGSICVYGSDPNIFNLLSNYYYFFNYFLFLQLNETFIFKNIIKLNNILGISKYECT